MLDVPGGLHKQKDVKVVDFEVLGLILEESIEALLDKEMALRVLS